MVYLNELGNWVCYDPEEWFKDGLAFRIKTKPWPKTWQLRDALHLQP